MTSLVSLIFLKHVPLGHPTNVNPYLDEVSSKEDLPVGIFCGDSNIRIFLICLKLKSYRLKIVTKYFVAWLHCHLLQIQFILKRKGIYIPTIARNYGAPLFFARQSGTANLLDTSLSKRTLTSRSGGYPLSLSAIFRLSYEYDTNEKAWRLT